MKVSFSSIKEQLNDSAIKVTETGKLMGKAVKPYLPAVMGIATTAYVFYRTFQPSSMENCQFSRYQSDVPQELYERVKAGAANAAYCLGDVGRQAVKVIESASIGLTSGLTVAALTFMATYDAKGIVIDGDEAAEIEAEIAEVASKN